MKTCQRDRNNRPSIERWPGSLGLFQVRLKVHRLGPKSRDYSKFKRRHIKTTDLRQNHKTIPRNLVARKKKKVKNPSSSMQKRSISSSP